MTDNKILPLRKIWHAGGGFIICSFYYWVIDAKWIALLILGIVGWTFIMVDMRRRTNPDFNDKFFAATPWLYNPTRDFLLNSSTLFIIGSWLTILFFDRMIAIAAILFLSVGDVVSEIVGTKYGRIKISHRTLEGSLAFIVSCLAFGIPLFGVKIGLTGVIAAAIAELISLKIDDNISIPILSGLAMTLINLI